MRPEAPLEPTILQTNDSHGNWGAGWYRGSPNGFALLASPVAAERAKNPNVLLLDAGVTLQGNACAQYFRSATRNPMADGAAGIEVTARG